MTSFSQLKMNRIGSISSAHFLKPRKLQKSGRGLMENEISVEKKGEKLKIQAQGERGRNEDKFIHKLLKDKYEKWGEKGAGLKNRKINLYKEVFWSRLAFIPRFRLPYWRPTVPYDNVAFGVPPISPSPD